MTRVAALAAAGVVVAGIGCSDPAAVEERVRVEARSEVLRVSNGRTQPIYVFAIDQDLAARANWAICTDPDECDQVAPLGAESFPMPDGESPRVIFYWWHLVPTDDGYEADRVRAMVVER